MPTRGRHFLFPSAKKGLTNPPLLGIITLSFADLAHLVERHLAKVEVASSSLVIRSNKKHKAFRLVLFLFVVSLRETRTGQPIRVATVRGTVAVPACVPVRAEAHRASLVIRSNKKHKAFRLVLFLFVVSLRETRTGQPIRVATVRGTVAVPACVPVRAKAHRASLVICSNKESKAFCLAFFVRQY